MSESSSGEEGCTIWIVLIVGLLLSANSASNQNKRLTDIEHHIEMDKK